MRTVSFKTLRDSVLRRMGLDAVLVRHDDGYHLLPANAVVGMVDPTS